MAFHKNNKRKKTPQNQIKNIIKKRLKLYLLSCNILKYQILIIFQVHQYFQTEIHKIINFYK